MSAPFKVSQSKVKTYRKCRQAYTFKYVHKLKRKAKSRPLQFGSMVHEMLERHANADDPMDYLTELEGDVATMKLFASERDTFGDIIEDARYIIADYLDHWDEDDLIFARKKGESAEFQFEIELLPDVIWNGFFDGIVQTKNKLRWLLEHKTFSRKPNDDERWRNLQSVTYFKANDILGWKPLDGCLWDYVKSKPPARPGILQNGDLSQKRIDTLPSVVYQMIEDRGEEADKYPQLIKMAEANRGQYFDRVHTPVNAEVSAFVFEGFVDTVKDMVDNHGKSAEMNIDKHCGWCDYESICRARLQGLDVDYVIEREFTDGKKTNSKEGKNFREGKPIHRAINSESVEAPDTKSRRRK